MIRRHPPYSRLRVRLGHICIFLAFLFTVSQLVPYSTLVDISPSRVKSAPVNPKHFRMAVAVRNNTDPADIITNLTHASPKYDFAFSDFLRKEYRFGLDPSRPYCKAFREGHCPLGNACPDKHQITHSFNNLVCKHWLRGLCKKGDQCEFLHEYNL